MTVAVFVENESDAECLIQWGVEFAASDHTQLLVVVPKRSKGKQSWAPLNRGEAEKNALIKSVFEVLDQQDAEQVVLKQDIVAGAEPTDMDRILIDSQELNAPDPARAFSEKVETFDISLLVLPAHQPVVAKGGDFSAYNVCCRIPEGTGPVTGMRVVDSSLLRRRAFGATRRPRLLPDFMRNGPKLVVGFRDSVLVLFFQSGIWIG